MITAVNRTANSDPKPLAEVMTYYNPDLINHFSQIKKISKPEAAEQLKDLYRWLWLHATRDLLERRGENVPPDLIIGHELRFIDEMWHTFLLFTRDYQHFSEEYLRTFIHHDPITQEDAESFRQLREENPEAALELRRKQIRPQLEFIHEQLGDEVLKRWYLQTHDLTNSDDC